MHTVYIHDKPLHFIDVYAAKELEAAKDTLLVSEREKTMSQLISFMESKEAVALFYVSADPDTSWEEFISGFLLIEAAGGLVENGKKEFLIIYRHEKWDLPKGKLEYDESPEDAALREVKEECGVKGLVVSGKLPDTFHIYSSRKKKLLKKTHWFRMTTESEAPLVPQSDEDIHEARWMSASDIRKKVFANTYESIAELLRNSL